MTWWGWLLVGVTIGFWPMYGLFRGAMRLVDGWHDEAKRWQSHYVSEAECRWRCERALGVIRNDLVTTKARLQEILDAQAQAKNFEHIEANGITYWDPVVGP